jgi:hypothetical protein
MFCLSCKYSAESPIKECVDSIIKFHPNEKILISDSQSKDTSYFNLFTKYENVEICENNSDRIIGSLWNAYEKYPNENYYILIHDSVIIKQSLQKYIESEHLFISFLYFIENYQTNYYFPPSVYPWSKFDEYCKKVLEKTEYNVPKFGEQINGCVGEMFIAKNELMKRFYSKGLIKNLKTKSKMESEFSERIIGICAEQEGYSPFNYNIGGDYASYNSNDENNIFSKYYLARQ